MTFGERLRQLRLKKGLTQAELAKIMGLGESTVSYYELDKREPDHSKIKEIAAFFNVSIGSLFADEDPVISIHVNEPEGLYSVSQVEIILDDAKDALAQAVKSGHITQEKAVEAVELARRQLMMIVDQNKK